MSTEEEDGKERAEADEVSAFLRQGCWLLSVPQFRRHNPEGTAVSGHLAASPPRASAAVLQPDALGDGAFWVFFHTNIQIRGRYY